MDTVSILQTMRALKELGFDPRSNFQIALAACEEIITQEEKTALYKANCRINLHIAYCEARSRE